MKLTGPIPTRALKTITILAAAFATISMSHAEPQRDLCADRPGLGTPPCTVMPGQVMVEAGLADWTLDRQSGSRSDAVQFGQLLTRIGLADHLEAQIGWNGYSHLRQRDALGAVTTAGGAGDVRLALRRNLMNPDGSGTSIAIMPYISLPLGKSSIGSGDWGTGVIVPISFSLPHGIGLALTPEVDAAVNQSGSGRHLAFGSVIGLSFPLAQNVSLTSEGSWFRDNDPDGRSSPLLSGLSLAWQPSKAMQFDIGANIGLGGGAPDQQIYIGIARRF